MQDAVAGQAQVEPQDKPQGPSGQPKAQPANANPLGVRKVVAAGKEIEIPETEVEKYLSAGVVATQRFQEAARLRKEAEEALKANQDFQAWRGFFDDPNNQDRATLVSRIAGGESLESIARELAQAYVPADEGDDEPGMTYTDDDDGSRKSGNGRLEKRFDQLEKLLSGIVNAHKEREEATQQQQRAKMERELMKEIRAEQKKDRFLGDADEQDRDLWDRMILMVAESRGLSTTQAAVQYLGRMVGGISEKQFRRYIEVKREDARADASVPATPTPALARGGYKATPNSLRTGETRKNVMAFLQARRGQQR